MKKFSRFTVYFIFLITIIFSILLLYLLISNAVNYMNCETDIEKSTYLLLIFKYFAELLGVLACGFFASSGLYQLINIANNTTPKQDNSENE